MSIRIVSNGSKWLGQEPDSVERLIEVLRSQEVLDPTFERYGNFVHSPQSDRRRGHATWSVHGNFHTVSHVFDIRGDTLEELQPLIEAIRSNQAAAEYRRVRRELGIRKPAICSESTTPVPVH